VTHDVIFTIRELARFLKIAEKTVYALAQRRELPAFKVGGQWRFSRAAIDSWIDARTRAHQDSDVRDRSDAGVAPGSRSKGRSRRR
jgi:excisionase family DNA binding protein